MNSSNLNTDALSSAEQEIVSARHDFDASIQYVESRERALAMAKIRRDDAAENLRKAIINHGLKYYNAAIGENTFLLKDGHRVFATPVAAIGDNHLCNAVVELADKTELVIPAWANESGLPKLCHMGGYYCCSRYEFYLNPATIVPRTEYTGKEQLFTTIGSTDEIIKGMAACLERTLADFDAEVAKFIPSNCTLYILPVTNGSFGKSRKYILKSNLFNKTMYFSLPCYDSDFVVTPMPVVTQTDAYTESIYKASVMDIDVNTLAQLVHSARMNVIDQYNKVVNDVKEWIAYLPSANPNPRIATKAECIDNPWWNV